MKQKFTPYIYIVFSALFFNQSYGQKIILKISATDSTSNFILHDISYQKKHLTENALLKSLDSVKHKIEKIGFINYNLDSLVKNDSLRVAYFDLKNQIQKIRVYYDKKEIPLNQLSNTGELNGLDYFEIKPEEVTNKMQNISNTLEKQGNSFSEVTLKNLSVMNDTLIEANLFVKKSTVRKIDKIIINGYSTFPKAYLKHYLGLEKNITFNKGKLDKSSDAINILPFVSEIKSPEVLFTKDSTIVYLYLKKENINKFDGLIGFTSKETGKGLSLNGYLDLSLDNLFNSGEHFNLLWKNNGNNRQVFNLDVSLPYIFNSKISPNATLNIYKQDSSFVNSLFKFAIPYQINSRNSIGLTLSSERSSNLLTINDNSIEDYKSTFYGINYKYTIPNNNPLFRTKFNLFANAFAGKRKSTSEDNQTKFYLRANYLWSLNLKNHIFLQNQSGVLNSKMYLSNELLRIGGSNTIRGFVEESILASTYSTFNIEYRYSTNPTSYLFSITDWGYIKNNNTSSNIYAFGLGYAFSSKLGFINLSYALGGVSNQSFSFDNSLFHLKIVNFF